MTRNIWNQDEQPVEDVPLPEFVDPSTVTENDPPRDPLTQEQIDRVKAEIAKLEAEENLDGLNTTILNNLRAGLAALGQEG